MCEIEVRYPHVMDVSNSWSEIKVKKDYEDVLGEMIFLRFLELAPKEAADALDVELEEGQDMKDNPRFIFLSRVMFDMIDCAVGFLGPDLDPLTEDLIDLGVRHRSYRVKPEFFTPMGQAVVESLEQFLGVGKLTYEVKASWGVVYGFMVSKMIIGLVGETPQKKMISL